MPDQLSFDLPVKPALGREDFLVGPCNAAAVAALDSTQSWHSGKHLILGPKASGKSHLVAVWCTAQDGQHLSGDTLISTPLSTIGPTAHVAIDDVDHALGTAHAEEVLFHLHNHVTSGGGRLLMTAQTPPRDWGLTLPDLISRLEACHITQLSEPDDQVLAAVLLKHFSDRQLSPKPRALQYLLTHMERSFEAAAQIAEEMDRLALAQKTGLTLAIAKAALAMLNTPDS